MSDALFKLGGIGALIWLVGIIIALISLSVGAQGLPDPTILGVGGLIGGIGLLLLGIAVFSIWKAKHGIIPMLGMIFGMLAGVFTLIVGIFYIASIFGMAMSIMDLLAVIFTAGFLICLGMSFLISQRAAVSTLTGVTGVYSLIGSATFLSLIANTGAGLVNLVVLPLALLYFLVFIGLG